MRVRVGIRALLYAALCVALLGGGRVAAAGEAVFSTTPVHNEGRKWRIAYYSGGGHANYYEYLTATVRGLMTLGWVAPAPLPNDPQQRSQLLWEWLAHSADSDYLEFVADAYYSAQWDAEQRRRLRASAIQRLRAARDIDLVIAMGTWAGMDLANNEHAVPTIVMSASDPVKSGIIASVEDSGYDHVHARVDPERYRRQVRVFHDLIGFQVLGIAYEDSVAGRSYAALEDVEQVARERGFTIRRCHTRSDIADQAAADASVIRCFERLSAEVDALYVTEQGGVNKATLPELVRIANRHRVPTFSQRGTEEVEAGLLLSLSRPSFDAVGQFMASILGKVMNGAKPRQLEQVFEEATHISLNLKTAEGIGLYLSADALAAADEIYHGPMPLRADDEQPGWTGP